MHVTKISNGEVEEIGTVRTWNLELEALICGHANSQLSESLAFPTTSMNENCFGFALLRFTTGSIKSCRLLNQSDAN